MEPVEIVLACADYGELLQGLQWMSWTSTSAEAVGTLSYNDCTPSCASGHRHYVPGARVILTDPVRRAGGQLLWSRIQETPEPPSTGPILIVAAPSRFTPIPSNRSTQSAETREEPNSTGSGKGTTRPAAHPMLLIGYLDPVVFRRVSPSRLRNDQRRESRPCRLSAVTAGGSACGRGSRAGVWM